MQVLLADIGGTNTRLALGDQNGVCRDTIYRVANRTVPSFYAVLRDFLAHHPDARIRACCIAIAGPVTSGSARLTNLDWGVDAPDVSGMLSGAPVVLVNDLAALGHAVGALGADQITPLRPAATEDRGNMQSLIVGIGTGLNVCAIRHQQGRAPACLAAEYGHCQLPVDLAETLVARFGADARAFQTVEACFSGRGLAQLYALVSDGRKSDGAMIAAAARDGDRMAVQTVAIYHRLLGGLCRQLMFQYLPLGGVYFSGSVARGLLGQADADATAGFYDGWADFGEVPVSLITDDGAALAGCHRLALAAVADGSAQ